MTIKRLPYIFLILGFIFGIITGWSIVEGTHLHEIGECPAYYNAENNDVQRKD